MAAAAVPALVTAGAGLIGARQQQKAVESAQRQQAAAVAAAQERLAPYQEQGEYATGQIREGLETGTLGGSFTAPDLASDPGYQFQLEQGELAQDRLQAARGNVYSGQAIKERERLSQGLASQAYQDAYNRWLQTQQNRYNILQGQQQTGYGAAGGTANLDVQLGQQAADATMASRAAQTEGQAIALGQGLSLLPDNQQGFGTTTQTPPFVGY